MNQYVAVLVQELMPYIAMALGTILSFLAIFLVKKMAAKVGLEVSEKNNQALWDLAHKAVAYAEEYANKKAKLEGELAPGPEKLQMALEFLKANAEKAQLKQRTEEELSRLLEAALHVSRPMLSQPAPAPVADPAAPAAQ